MRNTRTCNYVADGVTAECVVRGVGEVLEIATPVTFFPLNIQ